MKIKTKEFGLSEGMPCAVREAMLKRAHDDWQRRSDAAAEKIILPRAPLRIRGDSDSGAWFVEEATIERSARPHKYDWRTMPIPYMDAEDRMGFRYPDIDPTPEIKMLADDEPTAEMKWVLIGRKRKGWRTYAKALAWLREELEPIRDESVYFTPEGREAA